MNPEFYKRRPETAGQTLRRWLWTPAWEAVRLIYLLLVVVVLPRLCSIRHEGEIPKGAALLAVTHIGGFDPDVVLYATRNWRMRAVYGEWDSRFINFLLRSIWRFGVTRDPVRKTTVNPQTMAEVVNYLRRGGQVLIFPEGERPLERKLYPGVAVMAHRAGVPVIPVGLEGPYLYTPEIQGLQPVRALGRIAREIRKHGHVVVHFGQPIYPDPQLPEREDVARIMYHLEQALHHFYRSFLNQPGPCRLHK